MVKNYKRKTDAVIPKKMGYKLASNTFAVPQTTLERKVKVVRETLEESTPTEIPLKVQLGPKKQVFTVEEERELCNYI